MKKYLCLIVLIISLSRMSAQQVQMLSFNEFQKNLNVSNDSLYVLNFWATWCKPCIDELPYFENAGMKYEKQPVKIILVNLDFHSQVNKSVLPFIERRNIKSHVIHLTDTDANSWINKVDEKWSGAIPATVIYKNGKKLYFKEGAVTFEELCKEIDNHIQ